MMIKKILLASTYTEGLKNSLKKYGIQLFEMKGKFQSAVCEQNAQIVKKYIVQYGIDAVFSFDYVPGIAVACFQTGIYYISWVWDCPHTTLWHESARYKTNFIFLFDYIQYEEHLHRGLNSVWYLPLSPAVVPVLFSVPVLFPQSGCMRG